ncbi:hypothetical protein LMH87_002521 [Akanthomyces muscarius]|uniref:Uncharacterized protein n=1 Tax=Akanthomyces muscarius TaxID=2231603 RepID=A0A9W8Q788_AKAMU|nr:hypothetical protein LMH87_002521 [Akanthomyces muscarius]KAJ4148032.1 hypothetical protein LMH87_002521 [Akanthomyces muscarius]
MKVGVFSYSKARKHGLRILIRHGNAARLPTLDRICTDYHHGCEAADDRVTGAQARVTLQGAYFILLPCMRSSPAIEHDEQ